MITVESLRGVMESRPFQPFDLHMADGRSLRVPHPDHLVLSPAGTTAIVFGEGDRLNLVDVSLVTDLSFPSRPRAAGGRPKRAQ